MKKLFQLLPLLLLCTSSAGAQVQLTMQPLSSPAYGAQVSCIGDVNNDGRNDVIIGTVGNGVDPADNYVIKVHLQTAAGTLALAVNYPYKSSSTLGNINGIDIADLNNDGRNDVVYCYHDSIGIMYQNAIGGFQPAQRFYSGPQASGLKTGDLNHDGLADIAVCNQGYPQLKVFLQTATGFSTALYPMNTPGGPDEIEIGDVNGDGRADVVMSRGNGTTVGLLYVFTQTGSGGLNPFVQYNPPPTNPYNLRGIEIVDLNSDGLLDVAAMRGGLSTYSLVKWIQDPVTHLLQTPAEVPTLANCIPIEAADLDCDRHPEIVTAGGGNLLVYAYDSLTGYQNYVNFLTGQYSGLHLQSLSLGDYTGDSKIDVVIADFNLGMIRLHNTTTLSAGTTTTYITLDTLSTSISSQSLYFTRQNSYNNGAGYWVTKTDSLRATATTRRDSLRSDTMKVRIRPHCPDLLIDTLYAHSTGIRITVVRDTLLLSSRRDSIATGLRAAQRIPGLRIFPNPVGSELRIEAPELPEQLRLLGLTGELLAVPVRRSAGAWLLDASGLPPGMYHLQLLGADGQWHSFKVAKD